jgi:hypothetical protein
MAAKGAAGKPASAKPGRGRGVLRKDGQPRASSTGTTDPIIDDSTWRRKVVARRRIKFDDPAKERYLEALALTGRRWSAEAAAGVGPTTVDTHRENDPEFAEACEEAATAYATRGLLKIEAEAIEGQLEQSYDADGNVVREVRRFETRLREMYLKRYDPGYHERAHLELGGKVGVVIMPAMSSMNDWTKLADEHDQANAKAQDPDAATRDLAH